MRGVGAYLCAVCGAAVEFDEDHEEGCLETNEEQES